MELREVRVESDAAILDGRRVALERVERGGELAAVRIDGKEHLVVTAAEGNRIWVWCDGVAGAFERVSAGRSSASGTAAAASSRETGGDLISPMPGRVRRLFVEDGARVARGDVLLVLEAMKMMNPIRAPRDAVVAEVLVKPGQTVAYGDALLRFEG